MKVHVNYAPTEVPDFTVNLHEWQGKAMDREYVIESIQSLINDFESGEIVGEYAYMLCGDTMIFATREDDSDNPYMVTVAKVTHRAYVKRM